MINNPGRDKASIAWKIEQRQSPKWVKNVEEDIGLQLDRTLELFYKLK